MPASDQELLRAYVDNGSESAFAEVVSRYADLVYSAALRQMGQPQSAEEVTQTVFVTLARKAKHLRSEVVLSGWLLRATRFTALDAWKRESRRVRREQSAWIMNQEPHDAKVAWQEIYPVLDESFDRLSSQDREALALRFYQKRSFDEVGRTLGISEDAAKKRVARALDRLRRVFAQRAVVVPALVLGQALWDHTVQAAPAGLAQAAARLALDSANDGTTLANALRTWADRFRPVRTQVATGCVLIALLPIAWQTARLTSLGSEHRHLSQLLAGLEDRQAAVVQDRANAELLLRRTQRRAHLGAEPAAVGAPEVGNLDTRLFRWDESLQYIRVPKSLMACLSFDDPDNRASVAAWSDGDKVLDSSSGRVSETLLDAMGLRETERTNVQKYCENQVALYRSQSDSMTYLTNLDCLPPVAPSDFLTNADSRAWIKPALRESGEAWKQRFLNGLAELVGTERARALLRKATDDGSLSGCFDQFGADQVIIAATPLPDGQCSLIKRRTRGGEVVSGTSFVAAMATVLRPSDQSPADRVWQVFRQQLPKALADYLGGWLAAHPETPRLPDAHAESVVEAMKHWRLSHPEPPISPESKSDQE